MPKLTWTEVQSSNIRSVAYDDKSRTMAVHFHNGSVYSYPDVENEIYVGLVHAPSVGRYFAAVKGTLAYDKHNSVEELEEMLAKRSA